MPPKSTAAPPAKPATPSGSVPAPRPSTPAPVPARETSAPQTPAAQMIQPFDGSTPLRNAAPTPGLSHLSPPQREAVNSLKRKVEEISAETPPKLAESYLQWRLQFVLANHDVLSTFQNFLFKQHEDGLLAVDALHDLLKKTNTTYREVLSEEIALVGQSRLIAQDLRESLKTAETAYIEDIYRAFLIASDAKSSRPKEPRLGRPKFKSTVIDLYNSIKWFDTSSGRKEKRYWCSITGKYRKSKDMRCAHIVPFSFDSKSLSYLFGAEDAALTNPRNGIMMLDTIEEAWDRGEVDIVPDGPITSFPTEWKLVTLKDDMNKFTYLTDGAVGEERSYFWRELDGKRLTFLSDQRPACRYLYFRHVMSLMRAEEMGWAAYRKRVPADKIWSSPDKPTEYLRTSVLRNLARKVGDQDQFLEQFEAGTFEDRHTQNERQDEVTSLTIMMNRLVVETAEESDDEEGEGDDSEDADD